MKINGKKDDKKQAQQDISTPKQDLSTCKEYLSTQKEDLSIKGRYKHMKRSKISVNKKDLSR